MRERERESWYRIKFVCAHIYIFIYIYIGWSRESHLPVVLDFIKDYNYIR